jgi:hypothetical protein
MPTCKDKLLNIWTETLKLSGTYATYPLPGVGSIEAISACRHERPDLTTNFGDGGLNSE